MDYNNCEIGKLLKTIERYEKALRFYAGCGHIEYDTETLKYAYMNGGSRIIEKIRDRGEVARQALIGENDD